MSFDAILGQEKAVTFLERALSSGRVPHALLFAGPWGAGKATAARELAKSILCPSASPCSCGRCASCHRVDSGTHADLFIRTVASTRSTITIDEMRELSRRLAESPLEGERKVAVIDPADAVTPEAQNSLLKTLEEPPEDTTIILVAQNTDALLPTVRSRCVRVSFVPAAARLIEEFLLGRNASRLDIEAIVPLAGGSFAAALQLLEGSFVSDRAEVIRLCLEAGPGDEEEIAAIISDSRGSSKKAARDRRETATAFLTCLQSALSDCMRAASGAPVRVNVDLSREIASFAAEAGFETLAGLEKEVSDAIMVLGNYADVRLVSARVASAFSRRPKASRS